MALYIPHSIFHLARLLYVRPETSGPYYLTTYMNLYLCFPLFLPYVGEIWCKGSLRVAGENVLISLCTESRTLHRSLSEFLSVNFTLVCSFGEIVCKWCDVHIITTVESNFNWLFDPRVQYFKFDGAAPASTRNYFHHLRFLWKIDTGKAVFFVWS